MDNDKVILEDAGGITEEYDTGDVVSVTITHPISDYSSPAYWHPNSMFVKMGRNTINTKCKQRLSNKGKEKLKKSLEWLAQCDRLHSVTK